MFGDVTSLLAQLHRQAAESDDVDSATDLLTLADTSFMREDLERMLGAKQKVCALMLAIRTTLTSQSLIGSR